MRFSIKTITAAREQAPQHFEAMSKADKCPRQQEQNNSAGVCDELELFAGYANPQFVIPHVLLVSSFHPTSAEEDIRSTMERYGPVRGIVHKSTVAFIEYEKAQDAYAAKHGLHGTAQLGSDQLDVDFKKSNTGVKDFASEEEFMEEPSNRRYPHHLQGSDEDLRTPSAVGGSRGLRECTISPVSQSRKRGNEQPQGPVHSLPPSLRTPTAETVLNAPQAPLPPSSVLGKHPSARIEGLQPTDCGRQPAQGVKNHDVMDFEETSLGRAQPSPLLSG